MDLWLWLGKIVTETIPQLLNTLFKFILNNFAMKKRKKGAKNPQGTNRAKHIGSKGSVGNRNRKVQNPQGNNVEGKNKFDSTKRQKETRRDVELVKNRKRKNPYYITDEDIDALSMDDLDYSDKLAQYLAGDRSVKKIQIYKKE